MEMMLKIALMALLFCFLARADINVMPYPKYVESGEERVEISRCAMSIKYAEDLDAGFKRILEVHRDLLLGSQSLCKSSGDPVHEFPIHVSAQASTSPDCTNEYYTLEVTKDGIQVGAECPVGLVRAVTTLWQLMETKKPENPSLEEERVVFSSLPIKIQDSPRFEYRGFMLDTSRHYMQVDTIKRIIVGMMNAKLNALHWHMVDDDSFPMQSKNIPGLAEKASFSANEFYTVAQIKDIVQYAKDRGVRIIPEIDCPGHSRALGHFQPYKPAITCYDSVWPYNLQDFFKIRGGPPTAALDPSMDLSYDYVSKIIKDLVEYFSDDLIHLGGDEVMFSCWKSRPSIAEFMKKHNIPDYTHLMSYFIGRVRGMVKSQSPSKRTVYWSNEDTFGITYKDGDVLQYWGPSKDINKLNGIYPNNKFILSPWDRLYLDCGVGNKYGGKMWCGDYKTWLQMYLFEPTSYSLPESKIMGAEACAWAEMMADPNMELKLWPRMATFAETLWLPKRTKEVDLAGLVKRMVALSAKMRELGIPVNAVISQYCEMHIDECFQKYQAK